MRLRLGEEGRTEGERGRAFRRGGRKKGVFEEHFRETREDAMDDERRVAFTGGTGLCHMYASYTQG